MMSFEFPPRVVLGFALAAAGGLAPAADFASARVGFEGGGLRATGVTLTGAPSPASTRVIAGPREDVAGIAATGSPVAVRGILAVRCATAAR